MEFLTGRKFICVIILLLNVSLVSAQEYKLLQEIPAENIHLTTDYLGNLYVYKEFKLKKYDNQGKLLCFFEDYRNGAITSIDVSDPLKILIYFEDFMVVKVLDKTLSEISSYSLNDLQLYSVRCLAHSRDDNLWVFDNLEYKLKRIDENGKVLYQSENFNQLFENNVLPDQIVDFERNVYLNDPENGIYVFDRFGTYIKRIPIIDLERIQLIKGLIVYFKEGELHSYNPENLKEETMLLPKQKDVRYAQLQKDRIFIQEKEQISVFAK